MVRLLPLSEDEYRAWLPDAIRGYAADKVRAGSWEEAGAVQRSEQEFAGLLPDGPRTPGQHLFSIRDAASGRPVGVLWVSVPGGQSPGAAFVYDFIIFEEFRRRGYGEQALRALEDEARAWGVDSLELHVFGHNAPARALYEKAGYEITDLLMVRHLAPAGGAGS